jgi:hypothetical protein
MEGGRKLPAYYLAANELLYNDMPLLLVGEKGVQTTENAPTITRWYGGRLAKWDTFDTDILDFKRQERTTTELERCKEIPISMDPAVETHNRDAMTVESTQCGGELSISGRFFQNALKPVIHSVHTLSSDEHTPRTDPHWLPKKLTFGYSWITDRDERKSKLQPDVVMKLHVEDQAKVRLVGELKFHVTVDLEQMRDMAVNGNEADLNRILGRYRIT